MKIPIQFELENGIRIVYIPYNEVNTVTLHLRGKAGSLYELNNEIGAAHMLEHLALFATQKNPDPKLVKKQLLDLGTKRIGSTSRDNVLFVTKLLKEDLESGVEFLAEVFGNPLLTDETLDIQKTLIKQEIRRYKDNPEKYIGRICYQILYPHQRAAKLNTGDEQDIEDLTLETVNNFRKRNYQPQNFVLAIAGNSSENTVRGLSEKYFGNFAKPTDSENQSQIKIDLKQNKTFEVQALNNPLYKQTYLRVDYYGYKLDDDKRYVAAILAKIYDLTLKHILKTQLGLAYTVSCNSVSLANFGTFTTYVASQSTNIAKIIKEIKQSFSVDIKGYDLGVLAQIKKSLLAEIEFMFEKTSLRADYYAEMVLHGKPHQNHIYEIEKLKAVTLDDLLDLQTEIFAQMPKITVLSSDLTKMDVEEFWLDN